MAVRRPHRSLIVLATRPGTGERSARELAGSLAELGVEVIYLGRETSARRVAAAAVERRADAVELCLARDGRGVLLVRAVLRELIAIGRHDVSIVVHRVE